MPKPLCACGDRATATWLGNPICVLCFDAATRRESSGVTALLDHLADRLGPVDPGAEVDTIRRGGHPPVAGYA